jgi:hypothetical protein
MITAGDDHPPPSTVDIVRRADGELSIYTIVSRTPRSRSDREARQQDYDDPGDWSLPSSASCQRVSVWGRRGVVRARFIAVWEPDGGGAWKWCGRRGAAPRRVSARWRVASGFGPRPPPGWERAEASACGFGGERSTTDSSGSAEEKKSQHLRVSKTKEHGPIVLCMQSCPLKSTSLSLSLCCV